MPRWAEGSLEIVERRLGGGTRVGQVCLGATMAMVTRMTIDPGCLAVDTHVSPAVMGEVRAKGPCELVPCLCSSQTLEKIKGVTFVSQLTHWLGSQASS